MPTLTTGTVWTHETAIGPVSADVRDGLPSFSMRVAFGAGVPDRLSREVREEIARRLGSLFPAKRITVCLPAGATVNVRDDMLMFAIARAVHGANSY